MRFRSATGIKSFQEKLRSWSNLTLGKVQRNHKITNTRKYVLMKNQRMPGRTGPP